MIRKLLYKTYRGIPIHVISKVYDELYNKRINVSVGIDSPKLDTYTITFKRRHDTVVSLLIAESINIKSF